MQKIILASGSPRRREILKLMGIEFEVAESFFDEEKIKTNDPVEMVEELAIQKTLTVANRYPDAIIIGGDTTVYIPDENDGGEILNKANSAEEAMGMLRKLLGKTHKVYSGVCVTNSLTSESFVGSEVGEISFRSASEKEINEYGKNEKNWRGFAGAYALQGGAAPFALNQSGKLSAIIGLPVELTAYLLEQAGVIVEEDARQIEDSLYTVNTRVGIS